MQASSNVHLTQTAEWQEFVAGYPVAEHMECLRQPGQIFSELGWYKNKTLRAAAIDLSFEIAAKARVAFDDEKEAICEELAYEIEDICFLGLDYGCLKPRMYSFNDH